MRATECNRRIAVKKDGVINAGMLTLAEKGHNRSTLPNARRGGNGLHHGTKNA